jgi:hypothetical protein
MAIQFFFFFFLLKYGYSGILLKKKKFSLAGTRPIEI